MADTLIPVSIVIGDRNYRIKIDPADEEVVRKTVKTINDKIVDFKTHFAGKDMQDYVAMVLVWFATEKNDHLSNAMGEEKWKEGLAQIEKLLP